MVADISLALFNPKMVYNHRGRTISFTPDDLSSRYTKFLLLLSPNASTWSLSLATSFFHASSFELQEAARLGGYVLPDLSRLFTSLLQ